VDNILKSGVDVNQKTGLFCFTALHLACANGHKDVAELLLENGADVNAENKGGHTPLHIATRSTQCHEDIVQLLIDRGANINSKTKRQSNTALHYAVQNGYKAVVRVLIDAGAVSDVKNNKGKTVFHYAKDQHIKNFLLSERKKRNEVEYHDSTNISDFLGTSSRFNNNLDLESNSKSTCSSASIGDAVKENTEDYQDKFEAKQTSCSTLNIQNWIFEKGINLATTIAAECDSISIPL